MEDESRAAARDLAREFLDEEYRRTWAEDYLNTGVALQIAALRKERHWNQSVLAARAGTTQSAISRMEDVEYGAHSIRVLKQLADAFGLRLRVTFEEFGSLIAESAAFSEEGLHRKSFWDDPEIARLLAEQGLAMAAGRAAATVEAAVTASDRGEAVDVPPAGNFESFEGEFAAVLFLPLEDRVTVFKKWLMGYGLPSAEEPAYLRLYFSIPADERNGEWSRRAAEACAEWLEPERFEELMSDAVDGERAVLNLLRLSAALPAGSKEIAAGCRKLLPWLADEWGKLEGAVQAAVIDLIVDVGELEPATIVLGWAASAGLAARQRLKISSELSKAYPDDPVIVKNLAGSFDLEARRDSSDSLVSETSNRIIARKSSDREGETGKSPGERAAIANVYLNEQLREATAA